MDFLCCPECNSDNVDLMDNLSLRMGYAHKLKLLCLDCLYEKERFTSSECKQFESVQGRKKMEISVRAVDAFHEVGKGHEALVNVARCMNMFSITETAFTAINDSLQRDL